MVEHPGKQESEIEANLGYLARPYLKMKSGRKEERKRGRDRKSVV